MNRTIRWLGGFLLALILLAGALLQVLQDRLDSGHLTVEISGGEISWSLSWSDFEGSARSD